jgi:hypothetical protein
MFELSLAKSVIESLSVLVAKSGTESLVKALESKVKQAFYSSKNIEGVKALESNPQEAIPYLEAEIVKDKDLESQLSAILKQLQDFNSTTSTQQGASFLGAINISGSNNSIGNTTNT